MAVVVKNYRTYKCVNCSRKTKIERVTEGYTFGNPLYSCPHCGALNYDPYIVEPAFLSKEKLMKDYKKGWNTILLLLYMPIGFLAFFAVSMALNSFFWGAVIAFPILAFLTFLILRKRNHTDISAQYKNVMDASMQRLIQSPNYAKIVAKMQGIDPGSVYSEYMQNL